MSEVYLVNSDNNTKQLERHHCKDEEFELQLLLEKNLDLIPGKQINPDDPRRWILIKREMQVPDPNTGENRWSIDFFLADQDAIPTFVECKRYKDTRARREVVGQMFEYAANAQWYWTKDLFREYAENTMASQGLSLESGVTSLQPSDADNPDTFFEQLQNNLREGQIRLIFFMEEAPMELRSIVDFLNRQMERSEVLLVEIKQYLMNDEKIVVPSLFGYTEEARYVKRSVHVTSRSRAKKWNETSFFEDAREKLSSPDFEVLENFYRECLKLDCEFSWGTGSQNGTFNLKKKNICPRSFLTVSSKGSLSFNFGWLNDSDLADRFRKKLKALAIEKCGFEFPQESEEIYPNISIQKWSNKSELIMDSLVIVLNEFDEVE